MLRPITLVSCLLLLAPQLSSAGQIIEPALYERVLIPAYRSFPLKGALGSEWVTELTIRNEADTSVQIFQYECSITCNCQGVAPCQPQSPTEPHTAIRAPYNLTPNSFDPSNNLGVFVYVEKPASKQVVFQLRIRDISRSARSWGTEIPVVRESEMRTSTPHLLDVPTEMRFRQHLRIYGLRKVLETGDVLVRIYGGDSNDVVAERVLRLGRVDRIQAPLETQPGRPAYAQIGQLADLVPATIRGAKLRISVEPLTAGLSFWAFVTVTNNETQEVTTITPQ